ncbi:MAG: peptidase [Gammaproteobacteria bacterium]|nr:peptidase [Gammaproteobacteria bacterium]
MTYCVGIAVQDGLIFVSDSRTNAGVDQIHTFSKMHVFSQHHHFYVLLTAGNLATTQGVVARLQKDIKDSPTNNLYTMQDLGEAASYIGEISREEQKVFEQKESDKGFSPEASFIVGGQVLSENPAVAQIYPEGNFIRSSKETCYLQIGETKYGKPILDRMIHSECDIAHAVLCALVSMDSTTRSNATVGPPIEYLVYLNDSYHPSLKQSLDRDHEYWLQLRKNWSDSLRRAFDSLPLAPGLDNLQVDSATNVLSIHNPNPFG